jgi:hypothetical protein
MTVYLFHNSPGSGGVEKVVSDLAFGFARAGVDIEVLHLWGASGAGGGLAPAWATWLSDQAVRVTPRAPMRRLVRTSPFVRRRLARRLQMRVVDVPRNCVVAMDLEAAQVLADADYRSAPTLIQYHNSFSMLTGGSGLATLKTVAARVDATLMLARGCAWIKGWVHAQSNSLGARPCCQ